MIVPEVQHAAIITGTMLFCKTKRKKERERVLETVGSRRINYELRKMRKQIRTIDCDEDKDNENEKEENSALVRKYSQQYFFIHIAV